MRSLLLLLLGPSGPPALFYVLAVLLCYLLKCFVCSPHVLSRHHGMDFDDGAEFEKERFYDSWNLGNVVHDDDQVAASATVYVKSRPLLV